ncbi:MAG: magnesium and cobalt exporter, family, partial [Cyanobacteriota bacterium erpe_2018_sw_39hr_WHONDRS-SW48-000098_B_bin.30]|nr:magnesium and cobalt exporter, family [Cyanobacteriota bacterium erpe_2018_sw_39hr_WHONDRS-SW48-000098_B_bin.30]
VDAKLPLDDANDKLGLDIEDDEFNTIGGHVFGKLGREPKPGDEIESDLYILTVVESDRHKIIKLRLVKKVVESDSEATQMLTQVNGAIKNGEKSVEASH